MRFAHLAQLGFGLRQNWIYGEKIHLCKEELYSLHWTVVGLSTRPAFLTIFHFFQVQVFMVLQQAFSYKKNTFWVIEVDLNDSSLR